MKRILIAIALLASVAAYAQKSEEQVLKAIEKAEAACNDPKKNEKPATWLKLAQTYMDAHYAPYGKGLVGKTKAQMEEAGIMLKPESTEKETIKNVVFDVEVYPTCKYYYREGVLSNIVPTKVYVEGALDKALSCYEKAAKLDPSGTKTEVIKQAISKISECYNSEGATQFNLQDDFAAASKSFEKGYKSYAAAPLSGNDTLGIYNTALAAYKAGDFNRAIDFYKECIAKGSSQKGNIYAYISDCYTKLGNSEESKSFLLDGFAKFPTNQNLLITLINYYLNAKEDPAVIINLLKTAEANEPNNTSLFYQEGQLYRQLGQYDLANQAYDKCVEIDPNYAYGYIGKALIHYEQAQKIAEEADKEFNDKKYQELVQKFEEAMLKAAKPFEQAYEVSKDNELKRNLADYLRSIYYRFRDKNDDYKAAYEKFAEAAKAK